MPVSAHPTRCRLGASFVAVALVVALASPSGAANWSIDLYGDAEMSACGLSYSEPTVIQVHMFQVGDAPSTAVTFAVYPPDCLVGGTWVVDFITYTSDSQARFGSTVDPIGLTVAYGACVDMPHHIGYAWYTVMDPTVSCCDFVVSAPLNPVAGGLTGLDCNYQDWPMQVGKKLRINPDDTCPCDVPVSTNETTWGGIKALYR